MAGFECQRAVTTRRSPRSPRAPALPSSSRVCSGPRVSSVSSTPVSRTCRGIASRTCSSVSRFARAPADHAEQLGQGPRTVRHAREQAHAPALLGLAAAQHRGQHAPVDVAAGDDRDGASGDSGARRPLSSAATATAPAPSATSLARSARNTIASAISSSVDGHELVQQLAQQRQRQRAGALERDPVGDRRGGRERQLERLAETAEDGRIGRARARLHPDQLDVRAGPAQCSPDSAREPSAADGHDHAREVLDVLEQLERHRCLPCDHIEVVERVHERRSLTTHARRALARERERLLDRSTAQVHARTELLHGRHLRHRRLTRHEDLAGDSADARRLRDRARRGCRRSPSRGRRARRCPSAAILQSAPRSLKRARPLQALALERHRPAGELAQLLGDDQRRAHDRAGRRRPRAVEVDPIHQPLRALTHLDSRYRLKAALPVDEIRILTALGPQPSPARTRPPSRESFRIAAVQQRWHEDPAEHEAALEDGVRLAAETGAEARVPAGADPQPLLRGRPGRPARERRRARGAPGRAHPPLRRPSRRRLRPARPRLAVRARTDAAEGELGYNTAILVAPDGELRGAHAQAAHPRHRRLPRGPLLHARSRRRGRVHAGRRSARPTSDCRRAGTSGFPSWPAPTACRGPTCSSIRPRSARSPTIPSSTPSRCGSG